MMYNMLPKMKTLGYLLVVIFLTENGIDCFQRFSEQPKYTEVNPSQDALLTCKIIDKRGTCSWQKDNKPVGIYLKKYEWAAHSPTGSLHMDLQPPLHIGGDCSLWIRSATLDFDDGLWECQVTASDFTTQDALTSQPVRLVVRVAPQRPRLEHEGAHVPPGHNITVDSGAVATVKCVSHYGNPPATLKWYLGDQELMPLGPQVNSTEPDNPRTWSASSVVQVSAMRERHGQMLRCIAFHESYSAQSVTVEARMDIKYAPTIRLIGFPEIDLEEDKDALIMRCVADANPPASIVWRKAGRSEIASLQESLQLRPVSRRDAGLYTCQAQNSVGPSEQLSVQLDVKYPPKISQVGPDRETTAPLYSPAAFLCKADGNPKPSFKWVQRILHGPKYLERGNEDRLVIDNVTYDYQGQYECRATNYINGHERTAISEPISLKVVGAPQVLRVNPSMHSVSVKKGESASLSLVVCADPEPHRVAWEWGSLRLEAGAGVDRFHADTMVHDSRENCYLATLHIAKTNEHDSRPYYLVVENERGTDRHAIHLNVEEPLEMSYLMGIAGGCLAAAFILICLCIYAIRGKKCCFKGSSGYKSSDKDSEKADLKSRSDSTSGPQGDSIYTTPAGFQHHQQHPGHHGSPEAMKSTTTATTLENDLIWREELFQESTTTSTAPTHILRPSASAGTLYRQSTIINKRGIGGELLDTCQRHQRDLFSGDLGIPEINTHVGSVVHTFETLAMLRRQQQQQQQQQQIQPDSHSCKYAPTPATATPSKRSYTNGGGATSNSSTSKYNKLKRKSHEYRQKLALANCNYNNNLPLSASFPKISNHQSVNHNNSNLNPGREHVSSSNVYHCSPMTPHLPPFFNNFDDDYRKSQFGTLSSRNNLNLTSQSGTIPHPCEHKDANHEERIVNDAFEDIFTGYSCGEDEDDDGFPANRRHSRKGPAPQPPPAQKPVPPPKPFKTRSTTLTNIFERIKNSNPKRALSKTPSEGLLKDEQPQPNVLHKYANQMDLHSGTEDGGECPNDFLRGTTISQSFIRNPLRGAIIRENFTLHPPARPPPPSVSTSMPSSPPPQKPQRNFIKNNKMSFLTKRSKSSSELLLDDLEVQSRKYHQRSSGIDGADVEQRLYNQGANLNHRNFPSITTSDWGCGHPLSRGGLEKGNFKRSSSQRNSCTFHPRPLDRAEI